MSVCNCVISVKKCFLSPNNGFLRFCQGKTQVPIKNYILNSTNRITTVLCQKCLAQQAHIIRASTLHPSSTILLLSYIFLCEQKMKMKESDTQTTACVTVLILQMIDDYNTVQYNIGRYRRTDTRHDHIEQHNTFSSLLELPWWQSNKYTSSQLYHNT